MSGPYILCLDDDPDFLELYREIFGSGGYRVECCTSPEEARDKLAEEPPALVVTDLMMDSLSSGFGFAKQIKEDKRFAHVPVIVITAIAGQRGFNFKPTGAGDLEAMHADAFFDKPVAPEVLLAKVGELLKGGRKEGGG